MQVDSAHCAARGKAGNSIAFHSDGHAEVEEDSGILVL